MGDGTKGFDFAPASSLTENAIIGGMQRFRESEDTTQTTPCYDSQTVRQVLARASEIESQPESETLTAEQVETLGRELGLSPDAIRRALHERVNPNVAQQIVSGTKSLPPITRYDVKNAGKLDLLYSSVAFFTLVLSLVLGHYHELFDSVSPAVFVPAFVIIGIYMLLGPSIFPFWYGWRRKDWRQGLLLTAALLPMYGTSIGIAILVVLALIPIHLSFGGPPYTALVIASLLSGIVGGLSGRWWEDRKLAEER